MELNDGYVPAENFGPDHWSTLAYAETVMVDSQGKGFQVGFDGRMRQGRAHYRVMYRDCPRPSRPHGARSSPDNSMVMEKKHSTVLGDGSVVDGHDDWHCVQDLVNAGILGLKRGDGLVVPDADDCEPGVFLHLTPHGSEVVRQLRDHKSSGGSFRTFLPQMEVCAA